MLNLIIYISSPLLRLVWVSCGTVLTLILTFDTLILIPYLIQTYERILTKCLFHWNTLLEALRTVTCWIYRMPHVLNWIHIGIIPTTFLFIFHFITTTIITRSDTTLSPRDFYFINIFAAVKLLFRHLLLSLSLFLEIEAFIIVSHNRC
jgi:hypothetical protein